MAYYKSRNRVSMESIESALTRFLDCSATKLAEERMGITRQSLHQSVSKNSLMAEHVIDLCNRYDLDLNQLIFHGRAVGLADPTRRSIHDGGF
jgi:hypothetical protein